MSERWLTEARLEHAAIRSFEALAYKLAALGAPPELVGRALAAADDERRHTRACLELATRYGGRTWELSELPPHTIRFDDETIRELVFESWVDGCIGEGLAAELARGRAAGCSRDRGRDVLATIAREEGGHADLGFRVLEFLLAAGGGRGDFARSELARLLDDTHAPAFMHRRDRVAESVEGYDGSRLGAVFDRTIERGWALLT